MAKVKPTKIVYLLLVVTAVSVIAVSFRTDAAGNKQMTVDHTLNDGVADSVVSKKAFLAAYRVLMHPRCMNCHPVGDAPLQGEDSHIHTMNVKRGKDGKGLYAM